MEGTWSTERSGGQNVLVAVVMGDVDVKSLKEKFETCKHFLVDREIEIVRQSLQLSHGLFEPKTSVGKTKCCV